MESTRERLLELHADLAGCRACPRVVGTPVHPSAQPARVLLVGQAPGPREASLGRPFAWTAGRTLFGWFASVLGADEETVRRRVYLAAVTRCFPGKAPGGGDRRPEPDEVARCRHWLRAEVELMRPRLVIPVGTLAIAEVMGHRGGLAEVVGTAHRLVFEGQRTDVIPLPHPSGASTWHRTEPGKSLLARALALLAAHPEITRAFGPLRRPAGRRRGV
jgi:uracil-DNA glycosylase